jgi:hypothetical protein
MNLTLTIPESTQPPITVEVGGATELTSYVAQVAGLPDYPATFPPDLTGVTPAAISAEPAKGADDNFVTDAEKTVIGNTSGTNTGDETGARIATALNAGTQDTTAADTDRLAVTHPAGGWMLLSTLWTWITTKLGALTSITAGGAWSFSSTTRPTSAGTGTPAETSLITRADASKLSQIDFWSPFQWNATSGTANSFGVIAGDGVSVMPTAGAVAGNHRIATIATNPFVRPGSGTNQRFSGGRFSMRFSTGIRLYDNNEFRLLIGVAAATVSLDAATGLGVVWSGPTSVKLQINNGSLSSTTLSIPTCDPTVLQRWLVTFDGSTLRLYYQLFADTSTAGDWVLAGSLVGSSLPSTTSGTSINIVNIATGSVTASVSNNLIFNGAANHAVVTP